ncbi:biotin--[acetyl-CoA-carboxylase] ligase [Sphingomonas spermidinifaciens]|uniref:biotin--[biotin carboxyl-carrier protein] ligase n=1 Tax=Sphingomonas spermidinifaciens TaxID=1141889 RepID=A0A2A4B7D1_9SPHN|nr:biotin--[acetyl-CoA-carboxylase] ligase [Sphingomonas spermidinifaciens]PCD03987.1 biotin--[acetyl-CoA-carboxylase] ligase [Sphingomonas spermidinifaciens]
MVEVAETGSTNADLAVLAAGGAEEGLWLRADRQTAGRGRQGRAWTSPPGNFYGSTLVRLRPSDPPPTSLSLVAGVALHEAAGAYLPAPQPLRLKWPNDLLLGGAKLAGILLERIEAAVIVGIGVNLAHAPALPDRPTATLDAAPTPADFAHTLAAAFARWLGRWRGEGLGAIREAWLARAHSLGAALRLHGPDGDAIEGLFDGLAADGALRLRLADGRTRVIHAGDVFLI